MLDQLITLLTPQIAVTLLAAVAAFATVLTVLMPVLSRDRLNSRMQVMAVERDRMRAARLADLAKKEGQGRLRTTPKGFMQEIVDQLQSAQRVRLRGGARQAEDGRPARPGAARHLHVLPPGRCR